MVGGRQHILVAAGDALYAFGVVRITVEREGFGRAMNNGARRL